MNETVTGLLQLAFIPILYIASYWYLKPHISEWSEPDRGFKIFENEWKKIFTITGSIATGIAALLILFTPANALTSISIASVAGFLLIGAYTDSLTSKVPSEISSWMFWVALFTGGGALIANSFNVTDNQRFYTTYLLQIPQDQVWFYVLGGILACLVFFLICAKVGGMVGLFSMVFSVVGLWVSTYALATQISAWFTNLFNVDAVVWVNLFEYGIPSIFAVVFLAAAFDIGADGRMGSADPQAIYAVGWVSAAVIGGITIGVGIFIAAFVQIIVHFLAKPLGLPGKVKHIPYNRIHQKYLNRKWEKKGLEGEAPTTYTRVATPFLPVLNITMIMTILITLIQA